MNQLKYSRMDAGHERKKPALPPVPKDFSVTKRPMNQLAVEERTAIANQVLDRYINGEQIAAMAPEFGVSDVTIYALLLREHQDAWKDIQTARALARLERSQDELGTAADPLSLARAREQVRSAQWELERLLSRLYAQKQEITTNIQPILNIQIVSGAPQQKVMVEKE